MEVLSTIRDSPTLIPTKGKDLSTGTYVGLYVEHSIHAGGWMSWPLKSDPNLECLFVHDYMDDIYAVVECELQLFVILFNEISSLILWSIK